MTIRTGRWGFSALLTVFCCLPVMLQSQGQDPATGAADPITNDSSINPAPLIVTNATPAAPADSRASVYVLPIRENIMPPLVYLVRRGVKEAMEAKAQCLILDMNTDGGRVDVTEEIIDILARFPGETVTYVNRNAYSAGAFVAVATQKIYMAPESVIGAAAPIMMVPGGGVSEMPDTLEVKVNSAIRAKIRTQAQKNGHRIDVVEAMIDKSKELTIDGDEIVREGDLLTLTNVEAERRYGDPAQPLLSLGTVESIDDLINLLGYPTDEKFEITPTGVELLATWINGISTILLIGGLIGLYIEFKTPGFGVPGLLGMVALAIYFLGGYIAGLSGMEWIAIFALGLLLLILELFFFPGTLILGITGALMILAALVMAMVDVYPGGPMIPSMPQLAEPASNVGVSFFFSLVLAIILAKYLPKSSFYPALVSTSASGMTEIAHEATDHASRLGAEGTTISPLCPGGKARFGEDILDVITEGEMIPKDTTIKILRFSGQQAVVVAIA